MDNSDNPKIDKHFEALRHGIFRELVNANMSFNIFWGLRDSPNTQIMNMYRDFFFFTLSAHHRAFVISVHNIVEYDKETSNLPRFINYIDSSPRLSKMYSGKIDGYRQIIAKHQTLLAEIQKMRDKLYAHNELLELHPGLPYMKKDAQTLLDDLGGLLNSISKEYDQSGFGYVTTNPIHLSNVLSDLEEFYRTREQIIRSKFVQ